MPPTNTPQSARGDLIDTIRTFIDGWNDRCHPFIWTKNADTISPKNNDHPN